MKRKLDFSVITEGLIVGTTPYGKDYDMLKEMGVDLIINMRFEWPNKLLLRHKLVQEIWVPSIDSKFFPLNQNRLLKATRTAKHVIERGGKVYVYCRMGRHRSIVMTAAILILQGYSVSSVKKLMAKKRPVSDMRAIQVASAISKFDTNQRNKS